MIVLALCFLVSLNAVAVKINPQTGLPYLDAELLEIISAREACKVYPVIDRISSLGAMELLLGNLAGVSDTVISAHDEYFRFIAFNHKDGIALNQLGGLFSVAVHPVQDGVRTRGAFRVRGMRPNNSGALDALIRLDDFYVPGVVHYTIVLSHESLGQTPVEVRRFHLVITALSEERSTQLIKAQCRTAETLRKLNLQYYDQRGSGENGFERVRHLRKSIFIANMTELEELPDRSLSQNAFHFLRTHQKTALDAGLSLIVVPDDLDIAREQIPYHYIFVRKGRYESVFQDLIYDLENKDQWIVSTAVYEKQHNESDLETNTEPFVFTREWLNSDDVVRIHAPPLFVHSSEKQPLYIPLPAQLTAVRKIKVALTPILPSWGAHFAASEYYEVECEGDYLKLPVSLEEIPVQSWYYLIDIHLFNGHTSKNIRYNMVVLDKSCISHIAAFNFEAITEFSPGAPLIEQVNKQSICLVNGYCPLLVITPNTFKVYRGYFPSHAVFMSKEQVQKLHTSTFAGIKGEFWSARNSMTSFKTTASFVRRSVSSPKSIPKRKQLTPPDESDEKKL